MDTRQLQALVKGRVDGTYRAGPGLFLRVKGEQASWIYRQTIGGRPIAKGLGSVATVGLVEARGRAERLRVELADTGGRAPGRALNAQPHARHAPIVPLLSELVADHIATRSTIWKPGGRQAQIWNASLLNHAGKLLQMPVNEITVDDVLGVLKPLWARAPETGRRVRERLDAVLASARARGLRPDNPAEWTNHLSLILPRPPAPKHFAALSWEKAPAFWRWLAAERGQGARALSFIMLTACRSGEARLATWQEIDGDIWTIPALRAKTSREHRVPLSTAALDVLNDMTGNGRSCAGLIFPNQSGQRAISDMTISAVLRRNGHAFVPHGLRSTFRDWAADHGHAEELAERALAHVRGTVERAYARGDLLERRRPMMQSWGDWLTAG